MISLLVRVFRVLGVSHLAFSRFSVFAGRCRSLASEKTPPSNENLEGCCADNRKAPTVNWVAAKEFKPSYYTKETPVFTIHPHCGNLNDVPEKATQYTDAELRILNQFPSLGFMP